MKKEEIENMYPFNTLSGETKKEFVEAVLRLCYNSHAKGAKEIMDSAHDMMSKF